MIRWRTRVAAIGSVAVVLAVIEFNLFSSLCYGKMEQNSLCFGVSFLLDFVVKLFVLPAVLWIIFNAFKEEKSLVVTFGAWLCLTATMLIGDYFQATPLNAVFSFPGNNGSLVVNLLYDGLMSILVVTYACIFRTRLLPVRDAILMWLTLIALPIVAAILYAGRSS